MLSLAAFLLPFPLPLPLQLEVRKIPLPLLVRFLPPGGVGGSGEGELSKPSGDKSRLALPPPPTAVAHLRPLLDLKEHEGPGSDDREMEDVTATL